MVKKLNITAIVQARLSSERFPNKVIEKINNKNRYIWRFLPNSSIYKCIKEKYWQGKYRHINF